MYNVYKFKVTYYHQIPVLVTIKAGTYHNALQQIYYPAEGPQADAAELIGLLVGSTWKGDDSLRNASQFDLIRNDDK